MTYSRKVAAMGAAAVCFAAAVVANAQTALPALAQTAGEDEIINLLEELAPETPVKAEENAQPAPAQPEEKAPAKVAESPAPEAKPAAAPEPAAVEAPEPAPAAKPAPEPAPAATPAAKPAAAQSLAGLSDEDAQLVESLRNTELLRVKALSSQVERELAAARECSAGGECYDAARHYALSLKFIKQLGAPANFADARKECEKGIPENLYKYALQEDSIGRRERAILVMEKALAYRHPQAKQKIDEWKKNPDKDAGRKDVSEISQVRNTGDYKTSRDKNIQRLKRSSQFFGVGNIQEALNECELVLKDDPYNEAALKIRAMIQKKRQNVMATERKATHDGMIADVDEAWRPIYAVNAHEVDDVKSTRKKEVGPADPNRTLAQSVIKRMKEMRLPAISFKPPATIIDAVEYFKQASVDFDNPELPIDQRGFNFMLKLPETLQATAATQEAASGFSEDGDAASSAPTGVPQIPLISASDISLFEALKLVCESVQYKFTVQGSIVIVMHKNAAVADMITRSYPVITSFVDKARSVSEDVRSLNNKRGGGFGSQQDDSSSGEEGEIDWKKVFGEMGVAWPEGSSVYYMKATGKLRVRNTEENLAELERALVDLEAEPRLVEIEARFVEVCQEDLNSLGFEWILNSDYSLNLSKHLGKHVTRALGLKRGVFGSESGTTTATYDGTTISGTTAASSGSVGGVNTTTGGGGTTTTGGSGEGAPSRTWAQTVNTSNSRTTYLNSNGAGWIRGEGSLRHNRNIGVSGFGGTSDFQNGQRYLSTLSNHISGEGYSTNDQFMRLNAFIGGADLSMILHMLSQRSDTDLLSAPKVLTRPGDEATIKVVTEYRYPTDYDVQLQSSSSGGGYSGSQSAILAVVEPESFEMREVGVQLRVTPTLAEDGNLIELALYTEVVDEPTWKNYGMRIPYSGNSSLQSFEGVGGIFTGLSSVLSQIGTDLTSAMRQTFAESAVNSATSALDSLSRTSDNITYYDAPMEQPFFHVRSIDSKIQVYPGATIVMGGLITEQRKAMDDKIPFLGDLPFIGRLFRSHSEQTNKRNLLVFVTTRLVDVRGRNVEVGIAEVKETGDVKAAPSTEE